MNKNTVLTIVVLGVIVLGSMYVLSMNKPQTTQVPTPQSTEQTQSTPEAMTEDSGSNVKEISVEMGGYYFKPNQIKVKKGEKVKINFTNAGGIHDFNIDELKVKINKLNTGETTSVEFTADKAGSFEFYCSVGNHRQQGMKGTLVVE